MLAAFLSALLTATAGGSEPLRDATGILVETTAPVQKVVTLAPSLAEIAASLLGEQNCSKIVGISEYSSFPDCIAKATSIGPFHRVRIETILGLAPDLILATKDGNPADSVERLRKLGRRVVVVSTTSLSEIEGSFRIIGAALGLREKGEAMAKDFREKLAHLSLNSGTVSSASRRVFVQVGADPLVTVGGRGFLPEALKSLGIELIFSDSKENYPRPSVEEVIRRKPDSIWVLSMGGNLASIQKWADDWNRFKTTPAVLHHQVEVIDGNDLTLPTPRLLVGLERLKKKLSEMRR